MQAGDSHFLNQWVFGWRAPELQLLHDSSEGIALVKRFAKDVNHSSAFPS